MPAEQSNENGGGDGTRADAFADRMRAARVPCSHIFTMPSEPPNVVNLDLDGRNGRPLIVEGVSVRLGSQSAEVVAPRGAVYGRRADAIGHLHAKLVGTLAEFELACRQSALWF